MNPARLRPAALSGLSLFSLLAAAPYLRAQTPPASHPRPAEKDRKIHAENRPM